jgi:hypothetical protein
MFSKSFSYHLPYGTVEAYRRQIQTASLEKLAVLIKICGFLLQSKVHLFWSREVQHTAPLAFTRDLALGAPAAMKNRAPAKKQPGGQNMNLWFKGNL